MLVSRKFFRPIDDKTIEIFRIDGYGPGCSCDFDIKVSGLKSFCLFLTHILFVSVHGRLKLLGLSDIF